MPNHCTNILTIVDKPELNIREALANYITTSEDGCCTLDFDKVVPMPEGIAKTGTMSTFGAIASSYADGEEARAAYEKELEELKADNRARHGFEDWYLWRVHHWGTKWNSYCGEVTDALARFDTAWSPPIPVIQELSRLTGLTLLLQYIEEGEGYVGEYTACPEFEGLWDGSADECYRTLEDAPEEMREFWCMGEADEGHYEDEKEVTK